MSHLRGVLGLLHVLGLAHLLHIVAHVVRVAGQRRLLLRQVVRVRMLRRELVLQVRRVRQALHLHLHSTPSHAHRPANTPSRQSHSREE